MSAESFGELVTPDEHDEMEPAVLTMAEVIHECGFPPERSLDMAWGIALLPKFMNKVKEEW